MSEAVNRPPSNPYVGPRPFRTGEQLYGRDRERAELRDLLIAQRIVVLYAPSGAGKTSLIQAALIPELERADFHILPIVRVNQPLPNGHASNVNRYVRSALFSLDSALPQSRPRDADELAAMTLSDYLAARPRPDGAPVSDVLIFDQFEEILTLDPTDIEAKRAFFAEVGEALRNEDRWALFSLREDHLAALDPFLPAIPTRLGTSFRLDLLGPDAARLAMQRPALNAGASFTDDAAQRLVDDLRRVRIQQPDGSTQERLGQYIEPVQLQVVCQRLWDHLAEGGGRIDAGLVKSYGDVDGALRAFYAESVKAVAAETGVPERDIRAWFDDELITEHGVRAQVLWEPGTSAGLDDRAVDELVDRHLVRRESRRGALWFELAHDRLIAPIQADNDAWYQVNLSALQQQAELWNSQGRNPGYLLTGEALEQAEEWAASHPNRLTETDRAFLAACQEQRLLHEAERREQELLVAKRIAQEAQARQQAEAAARLEAERRTAEQVKAARRIRWLARAAACAAVVALIAALVAFDFYREASRESDRANTERDRANALLLAKQAEDAGQLPTALLLAGQSLKVADTLEARGALLEKLWDAPLATLTTNGGGIRAIAFSPKRDVLVAAEDDGNVRLWEIGSEVSAGPRAMTPGLPTGIAFAPDGASVAIAGSAGVSLRDAQTLEELRRLRDTETTGLAFSPDGREIVVGGADGTVSLLTTADGTSRTLSQPGTSGVNAVAYSPAGQVAAGREDGMIVLWRDAEHGERFRVLVPPLQLDSSGRATPKSPVTTLAFNADGKLLAAGDMSGAIRVWTVQGPTSGEILGQERGAITDLAFSPDSQLLAVADETSRVAVWGVDSHTRSPNLPAPHEDGASSLAFSSDGSYLASGSGGGDIYLWSAANLPLVANAPLNVGIDSVTAVAAFTAAEDSPIAVGGADGALRLCKMTETTYSCYELTSAAGAIRGLAFSSEGNRLAFSSDHDRLAPGEVDDTITILSLDGSQEPVYLAPPRGSSVEALAFGQDDRWLVAGVATPRTQQNDAAGATGAILLWNLTTRDLTMKERPAPVTVVAPGPGAGEVITSDEDVTLWQIEDGNLVNSRSRPASDLAPIHALSLSPVSKSVAAAGDGGGVVWDASSGDLVMQETLHMRNTESIVFDPDGRRLAVGKGSGSIYLWDIERGAHVSADLGNLGDDVVGLSWPEPRRLVAVTANGRLLALELDAQIWTAEACQVAGSRSFPEEDAQKYFGETSHQVCGEGDRTATPSAWLDR